MPPSLPSDSPTRRGTVHVHQKMPNKMLSCWAATGDIHLGMMGVTVIHKDGSSTMYPWRVIDWVEFPAE